MDRVVRAHYEAGVGVQGVSLSPDQQYSALACRTHIQIVQLRNDHPPNSMVKNDPLAISPLLQLHMSGQAGE